MKKNPFKRFFKNIFRRKTWLLKRLTVKKSINIVSAGFSYLTGVNTNSFPVILKVDISPICNLRCPFCIHGTADPRMKAFKKEQRMSVENFQKLVDETKDKVSALSLYYLGDPMTHPKLTEFCKIADEANVYTHISTNFSFRLSDEKIDELVSSGLDHFKVCVDGIDQQTYEMTRTGGKVEWVLDNLKRLCESRDRQGSKMHIEVQYILHKGNLHELAQARKMMEALGVDQITAYKGAEYTMEEIHPDNYEIISYKNKKFPKNCYWPFLFMTIKWNGDVIPCCTHRQDEQYNPLKPVKHLLGNVFETSLSEVWNSDAYRRMRKYVTNPKKYKALNPDAGNFCDGCDKVCSRKLTTGKERDAAVVTPRKVDA